MPDVVCAYAQICGLLKAWLLVCMPGNGKLRGSMGVSV